MFDGYISGVADSSAARPGRGVNWRPTFRRSALCAPFKRGFDIVASALILMFLAPAYALIAVAIALDGRGTILFRQQRTGLNGRVFTIYKFRTMTAAPTGVSVHHATRDDARVTRVGRFLRSSSLDEIPQLLNVLKGEMALVGPRPHAVEHDRHYSALLPNYNRRFSVRPGLTGLAQVEGLRGEIRDIGCMSRRVDADVTYATHWSFPGDLVIIARTLRCCWPASTPTEVSPYPAMKCGTKLDVLRVIRPSSSRTDRPAGSSPTTQDPMMA